LKVDAIAIENLSAQPFQPHGNGLTIEGLKGVEAGQRKSKMPPTKTNSRERIPLTD
jgi:hypothetical protein